MSEIADFAALVLVVTAGFSLAVLSTKLTERVPIPAPAIFLVAAAIASDLSSDVYEAIPIRTVERIGVVALVVILFNGGADIGWRRFRASAGPVLSLGIIGTFATAGALACFAHFALGIDWTLAGLLGAALAPTDPAVVFSVLGRREIAGRSGTTLEGEAGVNDPAGIALMLAMIEIATNDNASLLAAGREFVVEMLVGAGVGIAGGLAIVVMLRRLRLPSEAMYPVLTLMVAGVLYGTAALAHGSGFLAVFLAGLVLGDARVPYKGEIERFQSSLASFAELAVFVALGLTIDLGALGTRAWLEGAALAVVLALVVRPLVVFATLHRAELTRAERAFISWSGLKGAVPILLAAFAVLAETDGAQRLYGLVFVVVLISVVGQGTLVPYVARRLGIPMRVRDRTPWDISIRLEGEPGAQEYEVRARSAAEGAAIRDLPLGQDAWVTLVVRDGVALEPNASFALRAGDRLLVLADADRSRALAKVFRRSARGE
jgi:cell volume regulation protein A